ncbi:MAG: hypothetical protein ACI4V1_03675, partial [Eubacteriales bacterium]
MKKFLTLLLTAALLATASTGVFADEAVETAEAPAAAAEETVVPATITIEGLTQVEVTTSDTSLDVDAANFYDTLAETRCRIEFAPDAEETTFSVYTATKVPEAISKFAAILDGEPGTILTIEVYGTNDSLLLDWTPIALVQEEEVTVIGDYAVLSIADEPAA